MPLTEQEEQVRDILLQHRVTNMPHAVFPVKNRMYVVDFFLCDQRIILECWKSSSRRGVALGWIERNAAYVDLKFKRIKGAYPENRFIALVEVVHAQPSLVREYVAPVLEHADVVCCTMEEMATALRRYCEVGQLGRRELMPRDTRPPPREIDERKVRDVVISARLDKIWVAGMVQTTRGRIQSRFVRQANATYLEIELAMVDPEPVFAFSDHVGLSSPSGPTKNRWRRDVVGLRALRVLEEIRPILLGQRLKEAEKAIDFFAPGGTRPGRFGGADIWPPGEFPWRIERRGRPS